MCRQEPFKSVLAKHGYNESNLPLGVVLATTQLVNCYQMMDDSGYAARLENNSIINGYEYEFGDYTPGRYAWELTDVQELKEPIAAKGQLRLWTFKK